MRKLLALGCCIWYVSILSAQKPPIDTSDFNKWQLIGFPAISDDGKYCSYIVSDAASHRDNLVVRAAGNGWSKELNDVKNASVTYTADSKFLLAIKKDDTLALMTLGTDTFQFIAGVTNYQLGSPKYPLSLAFKRGETGELIIRDLSNGRQTSIPNVLSYQFDKRGCHIFLWRAEGEDAMASLFDLAAKKSIDILREKRGKFDVNFSNPVFDEKQHQLAILTYKSNNKEDGCSLWIYKIGDQTAIPIKDFNQQISSRYFQLNSIDRFSSDGMHVLVWLSKPEEEVHDESDTYPGVDIWNYKDYTLQSVQKAYPKRSSLVFATIAMNGSPIIFLNRENEKVVDVKNDKALIIAESGEYIIESDENDWNPNFIRTIYLASILDGHRVIVKDSTSSGAEFSPGGRFLIYGDPQNRSLICYNIAQKRSNDITRSLNSAWVPYGFDDDKKGKIFWGVEAWTSNDERVIIKDRTDLWMVDPDGKQEPRTITNGYGRRNNLIFHLATQRLLPLLDRNQHCLFNVFNTATKESGFYAKKLSGSGDPVKISMGAVMYGPGLEGGLSTLVKARHANVFITQRESTREFPNLLVTKDFKNFQRISDFRPHEQYNWINSELLTWVTPSKDTLQGVLYKPDDFAPDKKYAVIFSYYDRKSWQLNKYHMPGASGGELNIPWFVSRGYLVFTPDIHFQIGEVGQSATDAVVSGLDKLAALPYVDIRKVGIHGFSFGGRLTYEIVTRTNVFAAACAASGLANAIDGFEHLNYNAFSNHAYMESGQGRMGGPVWERPAAYFNNSPILRVDKVTIPLLMMHTQNDPVVPFYSAASFFTCMRRLNKKAWMVQYDNERHQLTGEASLDFTIRLTQFFDHYLKDTPAPIWMTRGIPRNGKVK